MLHNSQFAEEFLQWEHQTEISKSVITKVSLSNLKSAQPSSDLQLVNFQ